MQDEEETQSWLREQLRSELHLTELRAGLHAVRDERGWKSGEVAARSLWVVDVMPAFDPSAAFALVDATTEKRFCFVAEDRRAAPLGDVQRFKTETGVLPMEWTDPLVATPIGAALSDQEGDVGMVTLDGINYRIELSTPALSTSIEFGNPQTDATRTLERTLLAAANAIADASGSALIADYVALWRNYTSTD